MNRVTRRTAHRPILKREGDKQTIAGVAAVYFDAANPATEYRIWDDFVERIRPGAFTNAIGRDDVRGLFNHDPNLVIGRTTAGTLTLTDEADGLHYTIDPPDTQCGRDLVVSLGRGDVTGSSFTFVPVRTTWEEVQREGEPRLTIRWIEEVQLFDVGPVTFPAYEATAAGVRSGGDPEPELRREIEAWRAARGQGDRDRVEAFLASIALEA